MPGNHPVNEDALHRWFEILQVFEHRAGLGGYTLVQVRFREVVRFFLIERDNENVPPHGVIGLVHRWLAFHPCTQVNQVTIQGLIVFLQRGY